MALLAEVSSTIVCTALPCDHLMAGVLTRPPAACMGWLEPSILEPGRIRAAREKPMGALLARRLLGSSPIGLGSASKDGGWVFVRLAGTWSRVKAGLASLLDRCGGSLTSTGCCDSVQSLLTTHRTSKLLNCLSSCTSAR